MGLVVFCSKGADEVTVTRTQCAVLVSMRFRTLRAGGQTKVNLAHYSRAYGEYYSPEFPLDSPLTMCFLLNFDLNVAFFSPFGLREKH